MCYGMNCSHEDRYTGECKFHGRGYYPCNDWDDDDQKDGDPQDEGDDEC